MKRREFTGRVAQLAAALALMPRIAAIAETVPRASIGLDELPAKLPANIRALIANVLEASYSSVNTDWDGSIRIEGLLRFARRGFIAGSTYADGWLAYHLEQDAKMTDEEYYKQYEGPPVRILRERPLTLVLYSANLGVSFPAHELYRLTKNQNARDVCMEVADAILQYASRDKFGMLAHDDDHFTQFAIPDTTYWATRASAIGAVLSEDKNVAAIYLKQAIFQLEQGIRYFFDPKIGLVRTGLFDSRPGSTYWCRSQGWLLWSIGGLLRYLPPDHPGYTHAASTMKQIANGVARYQGQHGGLHVLVNDPSTPEEVTGTAMVVASLKEGMRRGWIPPDYEDLCRRGWNFILDSVGAQGTVRNVYTGWALTAEDHKVNLMDEKFRGFVPGIVMLAADEMTS
jgi:unsaturated rhamnogalacturonyl hydrolase